MNLPMSCECSGVFEFLTGLNIGLLLMNIGVVGLYNTRALFWDTNGNKGDVSTEPYEQDDAAENEGEEYSYFS